MSSSVLVKVKSLAKLAFVAQNRKGQFRKSLAKLAFVAQNRKGQFRKSLAKLAFVAQNRKGQFRKSLAKLAFIVGCLYPIPLPWVPLVEEPTNWEPRHLARLPQLYLDQYYSLALHTWD
jgi:hypothetical protein